jgi:F0F1-type ATP synthase assembly protein I
VVAGVVVGVLADNLAGTSPIFSLVGIGLGIVLGGVGFWLRVRAALRE